ncbi:MAG: ABC transporter permease [Actinomycetota bacterium]|nr:ABC transporter permease [Actinomycetota bacterium]
MVDQLKSLFKYKELLLNFAKKELKVKYKNSVLGFFWSLLNPILMMIVFTVLFTVSPLRVAAKGIDNFPIFFLAGLLPWNFFNATVVGSTTSIVGNGALIKKVYFPRELLPISIAVANLVNFALELLVLIVFVLGSGLFLTRFLGFYKFLPILLVLLPILFVFTLGVSLMAASLNVYFRDIQHIIGIILMVLFYSTPIIYKFNPGMFGKFGIIYMLNPMADIVLSFKSILYGNADNVLAVPNWHYMAYSAAAASIMFLLGYIVFIRLEPDFAEEV